jgi:hypothetical protein
MKIYLNNLKPNPLNNEIYGEDTPEQFNDLVEKIKNSGYIKPILITKQYVIVSGHRRFRAATQLGYTEIEYQFVPDDPQKQLELFLLENYYREKTNEQKTRESNYYFQIESQKSEQRRIQAGNQNLGQSPEVDLNPPLTEKGKTRDIVGEKVGLAGRTLEKSRYVVKVVDEETDPDLKWFFEENLNANVDTSFKLSKKPKTFVKEVMDRTGRDVKKTTSVMQLMEHEELCKTIPLPPGKYQVIHIEYGTNPIDQHYQLPLADVGEDNCVLFFWTTPPRLETSLKLINGWGFHYKTGFLWNKDVLNEISDLGEILLVAARGNPSMIKQTTEHGVVEKPPMIRQMIDQTYKGSKILITLGEGWRDW